MNKKQNQKKQQYLLMVVKVGLQKNFIKCKKQRRRTWFINSFYFCAMYFTVEIKLPKLFEELVLLGCDRAFVWKYTTRCNQRPFKPWFGLNFYYQSGFPVYVERLNIHALRREARYVLTSAHIPMENAARLELGVAWHPYVGGCVVVEIAEITRLWLSERLGFDSLTTNFSYYWPIWVHRSPDRDQLYVVRRSEFYVAPYHCRIDWFYEKFASGDYFN